MLPLIYEYFSLWFTYGSNFFKFNNIYKKSVTFICPNKLIMKMDVLFGLVGLSLSRLAPFVS